jgi:hypothetical protein
VSHGAFMARAEPDERHLSMWRVRGPDGKLSDLLNLPRAKDAAAALAMLVLNGRGARPQAPSEAKPEGGTHPAGVEEKRISGRRRGSVRPAPAQRLAKRLLATSSRPARRDLRASSGLEPHSGLGRHCPRARKGARHRRAPRPISEPNALPTHHLGRYH